MPHQNAVFSQPSSVRVSANKTTNNACFKLSIFLLVAAVVQISGWNKPVRAGDFDNSLARQTANTRQGFNSLELQDKSPSLPSLFDLLAFSAKYQAANSLEAELSTRNSNLLANSDEHIHAVEAPSYYLVKQGDTIYKIANQHQVSARELIELNQIRNPNSIFVNQRLEIPHSHGGAGGLTADTVVGSTQALSSGTDKSGGSDMAVEEDPYITKLRAEIDDLRAQYKKDSQSNSDPTLISAIERETESSSSLSAPTTAELAPSSESTVEVGINAPEADKIALNLPPLLYDEYLPEAFDGYAWPAQGVLTSGYGWRWGRMHRGIDIAAPIGTPIVAAASGKVIGAGWHSGYGNLIKLEHIDGSITYYAHLNRFLVTHGQHVEQGEQIAEMGSTGFSTGSHLHFEIHLPDSTVINPLALLGSR